MRRVQAIPGVESATLLRGLPMNANGVAIAVDTAAGRTGSEVAAVMLNAGPGFFDTLRIPLLFGRVFDDRDRADTPRVAVITDRMARERFGAVNAVGRRFRLANDPSSWTEVIGVVRDTGTGDFNDDVLDPISPPYYMSWAQSGALPTISSVVDPAYQAVERPAPELRFLTSARAAGRCRMAADSTLTGRSPS